MDVFSYGMDKENGGCVNIFYLFIYLFMEWRGGWWLGKGKGKEEKERKGRKKKPQWLFIRRKKSYLIVDIITLKLFLFIHLGFISLSFVLYSSFVESSFPPIGWNW